MSDFHMRWLHFAFGTALSAAMVPAAAAAAEQRVRDAGSMGAGLGGSSLGVGVSGKYFVNDSNAFQGLVGLRDDGMALFTVVDYLYNFKPIRRDESVTIGGYAGFGGALSLGSSDFVLGVSGILGGDFDIDVAPIDIYVEWRPMLELAPVGDLHLAGVGGGVRYYF